MASVGGLIGDQIAYEVQCLPEGQPSNSMARIALNMAYRGRDALPGEPPAPLALTCKLWLQSTNGAPIAYPASLSWENTVTSTRVLLLQTMAAFSAGRTLHFSNTFRKPVDGVYACILETYHRNSLYGQNSMPLAIGGVAATTNLAVRPMEAAKAGRECLKPRKLLNRKITADFLEALGTHASGEGPQPPLRPLTE